MDLHPDHLTRPVPRVELGGASDPSGITVVPDGPPTRAARAPLVARLARLLAGAAVTVLGAALVWWWALGGTWLIVSTPSMGDAAPVGTLLWVAPVSIDDVRVGDVITLHPPGTDRASSRTYTHRVVGRGADGTLETRGDLNAGKDPWRVRAGDLVGRVEHAWRGVGWLARALPLLAAGGLAWWALTALLASDRSRAPLRVLGTALLAAGALYVHNPLYGATQLSFVPTGPAGARATYVGTGLLPVQLEADEVAPVLVGAGRKASIVVPRPGPDGRFEVRLVATVPWQVWAIVIGAGLAPAVWSVIVGAGPSVAGPPAAGPRRRARG